MTGPSSSPGGEVLVYKTADGSVEVDVRLDGETVWLTQDQMSRLFGRERSVVTKHIRNIFKEKELRPGATRAKFAQVQREGGRTVSRDVDYYNLDVIISVGYRVKSLRGTQFRIWATRVLRELLLRGYSLNERRLGKQGLQEVQQAIGLLRRGIAEQQRIGDQGQALFDIVQQYAQSWKLLLEYDEKRLPAGPRRPVQQLNSLTLEDAKEGIARLRASILAAGDAGELFGQERGESLAAIVGAIEQTFGGNPLYPSAQDRAAHLFYFAIKDHPFIDGNKRIGSYLFLEYLKRNGLLVRPDGSPRFGNNAVVAMALLIAVSDAAQKEMMVRLVLNLLEDE
jgi:prophage maintenance system killer protein